MRWPANVARMKTPKKNQSRSNLTGALRPESTFGGPRVPDCDAADLLRYLEGP